MSAVTDAETPPEPTTPKRTPDRIRLRRITLNGERQWELSGAGMPPRASPKTAVNELKSLLGRCDKAERFDEICECGPPITPCVSLPGPDAGARSGATA